jgi:hypothetical protein
MTIPSPGILTRALGQEPVDAPDDVAGAGQVRVAKRLDAAEVVEHLGHLPDVEPGTSSPCPPILVSAAKSYPREATRPRGLLGVCLDDRSLGATGHPPHTK